jgi:hypothetical protein
MIWTALSYNVWWTVFHTEITDEDWSTFLKKAENIITKHINQEMCSLVIHQDCNAPTQQQLIYIEKELLRMINPAMLWCASAAVANRPEVADRLTFVQPTITPWPFRGFSDIFQALSWLETMTDSVLRDVIINHIKSFVPQTFWPDGI